MRVAERTSPYVRDTAGFEHVSPARPAVPNTARLPWAGLRVAAVRLLDGGRTAIPMTMKRAGEGREGSRQAPFPFYMPSPASAAEGFAAELDCRLQRGCHAHDALPTRVLPRPHAAYPSVQLVLDAADADHRREPAHALVSVVRNAWSEIVRLVSPNARGLAARRDAGIPKSQSASGAGPR